MTPLGDMRDPADKREGVVLLHGLGGSGRSLSILGGRLRKAGYRTLSPTYPSRRFPLETLAACLVPRTASFAAGLGGQVHFVTHSLGGLLLRAMLNANRPATLGRVVMLAPPNAGSGVADYLFRIRLDRLVLGAAGVHLRTTRTLEDEDLLGSADYELGIIAGDRTFDPILPRFLLSKPNDGRVTIAATELAGMRDHIVLPVTHTFMMNSPAVARQTVAFLRSGSFQHQSSVG